MRTFSTRGVCILLLVLHGQASRSSGGEMHPRDSGYPTMSWSDGSDCRKLGMNLRGGGGNVPTKTGAHGPAKKRRKTGEGSEDVIFADAPQPPQGDNNHTRVAASFAHLFLLLHHPHLYAITITTNIISLSTHSLTLEQAAGVEATPIPKKRTVTFEGVSPERPQQDQLKSLPAVNNLDKEYHGRDSSFLNDAAKGLIARGDEKQAEQVLLHAIHSNPNNTMAILLYSGLLETKDPAQAAGLKSIAYQQDPTSPDVLFVYSQYLIRSGKQREAEAAYKKAIESLVLEVRQIQLILVPFPPINPPIVSCFAVSQLCLISCKWRGNFRRVRQIWTMTGSELMKGKHLSVYSMAEKLNVMDSNDKTNFAGFLSKKLGDSVRAESLYNSALEDDPENAAALLNYAKLLCKRTSSGDLATANYMSGPTIGFERVEELLERREIQVGLVMRLLMKAVNGSDVSPRLIDTVVTRIRQVQGGEEREQVKGYLKHLPEIVRVAIKLTIRAKVAEQARGSTDMAALQEKNVSYIGSLNSSLNQTYMDFYSMVKKKCQEQFSIEPRGATPRPISGDESEVSSLGINVKSESGVSERSELIKSEDVMQESMLRRDEQLSFSSVGPLMQQAKEIENLHRQREEFSSGSARERGSKVSSDGSNPKEDGSERETTDETSRIQDVWDDSDELNNDAEMYFSHVSQADLKQIEQARKSEVGVLNGKRLENIVSFFAHKQRIFLLYKDRRMNFNQYFKYFNLETSVDQIKNLYFLDTWKSLYNEFGGELFISEFFQKKFPRREASARMDSVFSISSAIMDYSGLEDLKMLREERPDIETEMRRLKADPGTHRAVFDAMKSDTIRWNQSTIDRLKNLYPEELEINNADFPDLSNVILPPTSGSIRSLLRQHRKMLNASEQDVSEHVDEESNASFQNSTNFANHSDIVEDSAMNSSQLDDISEKQFMDESSFGMSNVKPMSKQFYESIYGAGNLNFASNFETEAVSSVSERQTSESQPKKVESKKEVKVVTGERMSDDHKSKEKRTLIAKIDTLCVGCQFYNGIQCINGSSIGLKAQREPNNMHDQNAVRLDLVSPTNTSLGYLMKPVASWIAPLMDSKVLKFEFSIKNGTAALLPQKTNSSTTVPLQVRVKGFPGRELEKKRNRKHANSLIPEGGIPIHTGSNLEHHTMQDVPRIFCDKKSLSVKFNNGTIISLQQYFSKTVKN
ncbi:hypothetical protein GUITHDRAFT_143700 [Guillardia theta CCMP2712]|uniref:HIRAN domain-containing protein n=2 Tax=Guillardia theta TaxID=55529 RepID=L1ISK2_GUITC|nr:hypothetical protein GUITHDRAFT_143700 [Guillardia theta CCMP2712]EKX39087.1 hypothetical protein GUITHDRAFT_143700 [Guillardia theta CCMP2712]|eukprot:XP_005826067.1 hypothetical protein GUITHDRAFT_143700 [Guillardia theta CCMP2712]